MGSPREQATTAALQEAQVVPAGADRRGRIGAQPAGQQFVVDVAEISSALEVAVVKVGEAGFVAVEPALDRCPGDEDWPGGAMVGALGGVGRNPAPEFRISQHNKVFAVG